MGGVGQRRAWIAIGGITAAALLLRAAGLGAQPLLGDDGAVGISAVHFVERGWPGPTMWNHPRVRDLLVWTSVQSLGPGPWGLKIWSVLLGTASVAATGALVLALSGSVLGACLAAGLVAIDPLHLDFSRQAINDVYTAFLPVAAVIAVLRYGTTRHAAWLVGAGALLGVGLAGKWNSAFPVGAAAAVVLLGALRGDRSRRERSVEIAFFVACLVVLPAALYLLTYAPWFGRGHDLAEWLRFQAAMAVETATHAGYEGTKQAGYPGEIVSALRWFTTPVWYADVVPPATEAQVAAPTFVVGVANTLACLAVLPAVALAVVRRVTRADATAGWLAYLFAAAWLPFVVVPRPVWTNSAVSVLPWAFALVGWALAHAYARARAAATAYAVAALTLAALLWLPAMGISTRPTDAVLHALVPPSAFERLIR